MDSIKNIDYDIYNLIQKEKERQFDKIRLIASENYTSKAVMQACGTILTNKYSEGYPGKRYYEGQQFIDQIEQLAIDRAKKLFKAEHANVQVLSGSPANMAVYLAFLKPYDKIMGLNLPHGGHLTHGWKVSASGKIYNSVFYNVNKSTGLLDYNEIRNIAKKEKPKIIIAGTSSYTRIIDYKIFSEIAKEVNAILMADIAHISGLIAGGVHPNPFPYADVVTTTTHKTLRGPRGGMILCKKIYAKKIDSAVFPGIQGGPHQNVIAGVAIALKLAMQDDFKKYAKQIINNSKSLANYLKDFDFKLVSDGTDNHIILVDMTNKNITGKKMAQLMDKAGLVCNSNTIPYDKNGALNPSGIRLGTAAITSRKMKEEQMKQIAIWMNKIVENKDDENKINNIAIEVKKLCSKFKPLGF